MRILRLTMGSLTCFGGIESHITYLNGELERQGVKVLTEIMPGLSNDTGGPADGERTMLPQRLAALVRHENVHLIHSHNLHMDAVLATAAIDVAVSAGLPHVLTIHDIGDDFTALSSVANVLRGMHDTHVVVTSEYNARRFASLTGREPVALIPPGIDFGRFSARAEYEPRTIAYPSRLTPEKGALNAIALLRFLAEVRGPVHVLLSDRTRLSYGRSTRFVDVLDHELTRTPMLTGEFVSGADAVPAIYHRAALTLVMPQRPEGFGLVPLESLACGRPVVAVPTGGMEWLVGVPGAVCLHSPSRPDVLSAIRNILDDWHAWFDLARSARAILQSRYDVHVTAGQYKQLYGELCGRVAQAPP